MWFSMIKDDCIPEGDGQVASCSASLPDPVALDTKEQTLERKQNECDVLEALGEYKCDAGMSVEGVPALVNKKTYNSETYCWTKTINRQAMIRGRRVLLAAVKE